MIAHSYAKPAIGEVCLDGAEAMNEHRPRAG
jgi:hypothetical protein